MSQHNTPDTSGKDVKPHTKKKKTRRKIKVDPPALTSTPSSSLIQQSQSDQTLSRFAIPIAIIIIIIIINIFMKSYILLLLLLYLQRALQFSVSHAHERSDDESDSLGDGDLLIADETPGQNLAVRLHTGLSRKQLFQKLADDKTGVPGLFLFLFFHVFIFFLFFVLIEIAKKNHFVSKQF